MKKITEDELIAIIDHDVSNSIGSNDGQLSASRIEAQHYYMGDRVGRLSPSEIEDSSEVVSRDVMDTIEWIMPSLMRIFTSGDDVVAFEPVGAEDQGFAEQATDWCNYVFNKKNKGFLVLHNWFKDALLLKMGVVKTWWNEEEDVTTEEYSALTEEQLLMLDQDPAVEIIEASANEEGLYSIKVSRTKSNKQICIENVPPEEFLFNRDARNSEDITSAHHRMQKTVSELRLAGYKNVDDLMGDDTEAELSEEAQVRNDDVDEFNRAQDESLDETMRKVWVTESYLKVDWDGDGIAEWRKILKSGNVILDNEECDGHPFDIITPILMPHRLVGLSVADLVMDLQEIKTALLRQMLDNMYLTNNPRTYVDTNQSVDVDALLDARIGGIVRGKGPNGITPIVTQPMSGQNFMMMEYVDSIRENRTGVTRYNQGLDANSLNKTASGINAIMGASKQREELIARVFAETGVTNLFKRILKLSSKYETKPQIIRLRNKFVEIDPRAWSNEYDVTVSVGIGTGNKEQQAAQLMGLMAIQEKMLAAKMSTIDEKRVYNAAVKYAENLGYKDGDLFFKNPEEAQAQPKQPPQPHPDVVKTQMQAKTAQDKLQAETAVDVKKIATDAEIEKYKADKRAETEILKAKINKGGDVREDVNRLVDVVAAIDEKVDSVRAGL